MTSDKLPNALNKCKYCGSLVNLKIIKMNLFDADG